MSKPMPMPVDCARFEASITAYIDGELDCGHAVDMEAHAMECGCCSERVALLRATRSSLKRCATRKASEVLRERICGSIARERERAAQASRSDVAAQLSPGSLIRLRYAVAVAAAAGIVFAMGIDRYAKHPGAAASDDLAPTGAPGAPRPATAGIDTLLDDLVALHANPLPAETTNPEELEQFEPLVGVPVRRPAFQPFGGRFRGARIHAMADRRAVLLEYTITGNHRVTVYEFDTRIVPVQATRLRPRVVSERPVYVGRLRGYSVAAVEQSGVGYALASDLDDDESTELVLAAARQ